MADSAQFSAMVTEVAPSDAVGTALMLQTSVGFLLSTITIQGLGLDLSHAGPGAGMGIASIVRLGHR